MKKTIAVILMLGVSFPLLAQGGAENKLICTIKDVVTGEVSHETFTTWDADQKERHNHECEEGHKSGMGCAIFTVSTVAYTITRYSGYQNDGKTVVDRIDGSYKVWLADGKLDRTGTCKPFEAKF